MNSFRQINRPVLLFCSLLLALALLSAQGTKLHVHNIDHGDRYVDYHVPLVDTHVIDETGDHNHLSKAHFTHDISSGDHHNSVISEVDVSPDGVLKNSGNNVFSIIIAALFFIVVMFVSTRQFVQRCRESKLILYGYYLLSPPLRAPPQH